MSSAPDILIDYETTPSAPKAIAIAFETLLAGKHTAMPGVVQSYDADLQEITVQPAVRRRFKDGRTERFTALARVPLMHYQLGGFVIHAAPAPGDAVLLIFAERSITEWLLVGGADVTAADPRRFDLQDAIAIAGLSPNNAPIPAAARPASTLSISTRDGATRIDLAAGGQVTITSPDVRIGSAAATPLSLDSLVQAELGKILLNLTALNTAVNGLVPGAVVPPNVYVQGATAATRAKGV